MNEGSNEDDGEPAVLSESTLAVLNQFLQDRRSAEAESSKDPFAEDWGMSQVSSYQKNS